MKSLAIAVGALVLALVTGCTQADQAVSSVCAEVAKIDAMPAASGPLNALDPSSAAGVLWADAQSACENGAPTPGVATDWAQLVEQELLALLPSVLPAVAALL